MSNQQKPKDASGIATLFIFLFIISGIINVYSFSEITRAKKFLPQKDMSAVASPNTLTRDLISGEVINNADKNAYEYSIGMRKNMMFTDNNCVAEECLYLRASGYPKTAMNDSLKKTLSTFGEKVNMFASHIFDAKKSFGTPFIESSPVIRIITSRIASIMDKYSVTAGEIFTPIVYNDKKDACLKLSKELAEILQEYTSNIEKTFSSQEDIFYVLSQAKTILELVHKPVLTSCSK